MKLSRLAQALARIPDFNTPRLELEQYATPPAVAASLLLEAHRRGHIAGRHVADLGCGTGRLAVGAALLGAEAVEALELDPPALEQARRAAVELGVADRMTFTCLEVSHWTGTADTVVMNPPFGSQRKRADRPFVEAALQGASHIHLLHLGLSGDYWQGVLAARELSFAPLQTYIVELPPTYPHHIKMAAKIEIVHSYIDNSRLQNE